MSSEQSGTSDDGAARPFLMRCRSCRWSERTTGLSKDLVGFRELVSSCSKCGKPRRFACPKCRGIAVMRREPS